MIVFATVGAIALQDYSEATAVVFLFSLSISRDYSTLEDDDISSLIFNNPTTNTTMTHLSSTIQQPTNIQVVVSPSSSTTTMIQECMDAVSEQISRTTEQDVTVQKDIDLLLILANVPTSFSSLSSQHSQATTIQSMSMPYNANNHHLHHHLNQLCTLKLLQLFHT
jgi:hypothetical protein